MRCPRFIQVSIVEQFSLPRWLYTTVAGKSARSSRSPIRGGPHGKHRGLSCSRKPRTRLRAISALGVSLYRDCREENDPRTLRQSQLSQQGCQLGSARDDGDCCRQRVTDGSNRETPQPLAPATGAKSPLHSKPLNETPVSNKHPYSGWVLGGGPSHHRLYTH